jgi:DedD protein
VERLAKERLVGAAVLLAAAVILIPEMLSGPKREESSLSRAAPVDEAPTKTYTIDLGQPSQRRPDSSAPAQVETTDAPPSETALPPVTATTPAAPESNVQQTQTKRDEAPLPVAKPVTQPSVESAVPSPPVSSAPKRESAESVTPIAKPAAVATERTAPTSRGWAVQLGSFSKADSAERLAQQVRSKGHNAFVMPVKSANGTLYRVRVGPMQERSAADALQRQLKGDNPNAAVVPHP